MNMLEDTNGNKSSKRVIGTGLIIGASIMAIVLFIFSLVKVVADSSTSIDIIKTLLYVGGALLGIGVVEHLGKQK